MEQTKTMATITPTFVDRERRGFSLRDGFAVIALIINLLTLGAIYGRMQTQLQDLGNRMDQMNTHMVWLEQQLMQKGLNK